MTSHEANTTDRAPIRFTTVGGYGNAPVESLPPRRPLAQRVDLVELQRWTEMNLRAAREYRTHPLANAWRR